MSALSLILFICGIGYGLTIPSQHVKQPSYVKHLKKFLAQHDQGVSIHPDAKIPDNFKNTSGKVDFEKALFKWDFSSNEGLFNRDPEGIWTLAINNYTVKTSGSIKDHPQLVHLKSKKLKGTKCVYFSAFTDSMDINFAISMKTVIHKIIHETITGLPGNRLAVKKISVGLSSSHDYEVLFHLFAFKNYTLPTSGLAYLERISIVDGPCAPDKRSLNCTFDYGLCDWTGHSNKSIWFSVPFGKHPEHKHEIDWAAIAPYIGKTGLWSPESTAANSRCFFFSYVKGKSFQSYLRVWILYRIPGVGDKKVLAYENFCADKMDRKYVKINLSLPWKFQVAFEGRSETLMHGVVLLKTSIINENCEGLGDCSEVFQNPSPTKISVPKYKTSAPMNKG